ncbi:hypothetical protein LCX93_01365 [Sulfurimonas sp. SWIR-19]|uniref:hypothetical protein n=1 Tax=Sulfurimonas sp. SWIR-19 TaxID=2878390 RepID=UPI001CF49F7E|nr:hypothetical protein [Sulfurimonas sp. SWIR-19]UCN00592.1 hypothetical protein LCX93_01365 [Sulfurimonas sp. SWIR-19]
MEKMIQYLIKYNLLFIIPIDKLFFLASNVPEGTKLSKELIAFNYAKKSPFKNPFICYYQEENSLYVWFTKAQPFKALFVVPESFFIYKALQDMGDGIFVFKGETQLLFVMKNKRLLGQFQVNDASEITVAQEEYSLENITTLSSAEYNDFLKKGLKKLKLHDLKQFVNIDFSKEKVQDFILQKLTYPLVAALVFYMLVTFSQAYFMQNKIEKLTREYKTLQQQNTKTKEMIAHHNQVVEKLNSFAKEELQAINPLQIVYDLNKIILPTDKAKVVYLDITSNLVQLRIQTKKDDGIKYLQRLNKLAYVKEVIITNTYTRRGGIKVYNYTITLNRSIK